MPEVYGRGGLGMICKIVIGARDMAKRSTDDRVPVCSCSGAAEKSAGLMTLLLIRVQHRCNTVGNVSGVRPECQTPIDETSGGDDA